MSRKTVRILCFGDSNTWGCKPIQSMQDVERFSYDIRWPGILSRKLGPGFQIIEEGNPSRTTVKNDILEPGKNGLEYLIPCLDSHQPIDLVILMLGTNDLKFRYSMTAADIAEGVRVLVRTIKGKHLYIGAIPRVLVICPAPIKDPSRLLGDMFLEGFEKSRSLGQAMRRIAEDEGCPFIDAGEFIDVDELDGIHLSKKSHAILGEVIAKKVMEFMK